MMLPPRLDVYHWPHVTLTFDLTCKVDRFMPLPCSTPVPIGIKIGLVFFKVSCSQVWQLMNKWTTSEHHASACWSGPSET